MTQFDVFFITQTYPSWPECVFKERTINNLRPRPILSVIGIVFHPIVSKFDNMYSVYFKRSMLQSTLSCQAATLFDYSSNSLGAIANQSPTHKAANLKSVNPVVWCLQAHLFLLSPVILCFRFTPLFVLEKKIHLNNELNKKNWDGKGNEVVFSCSPASRPYFQPFWRCARLFILSQNGWKSSLAFFPLLVARKFGREEKIYELGAGREARMRKKPLVHAEQMQEFRHVCCIYQRLGV